MIEAVAIITENRQVFQWLASEMARIFPMMDLQFVWTGAYLTKTAGAFQSAIAEFPPSWAPQVILVILAKKLLGSNHRSLARIRWLKRLANRSEFRIDLCLIHDKRDSDQRQDVRRSVRIPLEVGTAWRPAQSSSPGLAFTWGSIHAPQISLGRILSF